MMLRNGLAVIGALAIAYAAGVCAHSHWIVRQAAKSRKDMLQ